MAEFTGNKSLYKWNLKDTKRTTINEMENNAQKIDDAFGSVEGKINETNQRFNDLALVDANTEMVIARGEEATLGARLDKQTSQLAQSAQQIKDIAPKPVDLMKGGSFYFKDNITIGYITDSMLDYQVSIGVTHIVLCPILENDSTIDSNNISMSYTTTALSGLITRIINKGLKVVIKFHLNNKVTSENTYYSVAPSNPTAFFNNFKNLILTTLGVSQDVSLLCIANEANTLTKNYRSNWETLFSAIRAQNPTLKITNSPVFSDIQYDVCVFWDLCDYIGANVYPNVSSNAVLTVEESRKSMFTELSSVHFTYVKKFLEMSKKYNKKFIVTEFACLPYEYQGTYTGSWQPQGVLNEQVQANHFEGVLDVFTSMESCAGIFIWDFTDNFTPKDRLAESVIINAFKGGS